MASRTKRTVMTVALAAIALSASCSTAPRSPLHDTACVPIPPHKRQVGSQGMKTWSDDRLRAFAHTGEVYCVPDGWEPVGAHESVQGKAVYPEVQTAVIVRSDAFDRETFEYENTRFPVEVLWPATTPRDELTQYHRIIEAAFRHVGALYPALPDDLAAPHQVLVTAGVGGNTYSAQTRIYPEPGTAMSILVRRPDRWRAEELLIHAVGHLYNRHRPYWLGDQRERLPIAFKEWQELVATWTESAFIEIPRARRARLRYLYGVHTAVREDDFSKITRPPFDNETLFHRIVQNVDFGGRGSNLTIQYNHYILSPLSMVATEGLLGEVAPETTVARLLRETFSGRHDSYHEALRGALGEEAFGRVQSWWSGEATIPEALVLAGADRYDLGAALRPDLERWQPAR